MEIELARQLVTRRGTGSLQGHSWVDAPSANMMMFKNSSQKKLATQPLRRFEVTDLLRYGSQRQKTSSKKTLVLRLPKQSWMQLWMERLWTLSGLSDNWDNYGAQAPAAIALSNASICLQHLSDMDYQPSKLLPSAGGGVVLVFANDKDFATIEFLNSGDSILELRQKNQKAVIEVVPSLTELTAVINRIKQLINAG